MTRIFMAVSLLLTVCGNVHAQQQDLLSGRYNMAQLKSVLTPYANWKPFPRAGDQAGWAKADPATMKAIVQKAESLLDYEWPGLPAVKSLLIVRNGNRDEYQTISFKKREVLGLMMLAEAYENKGRFTDQVINGIWSICEESFWGVPAHLPKGKEYGGLVDVSAPFVDLFAAETGTYLAWADYFLGDKLDAVSPQVRKRIYYETDRRIFQPLMTKHHGWMASNANGRRPNNWNPWICSNWLNTVLLLEKDDTRRVAGVEKVLKVLDAFLNPHPLDGGCDEGPGYWGAAAASLYDNVSLLNLASNNAFDYVFRDEKVRNMGQFIYKAQISERYFLNFADADPQPGMAGSMIYRYGKAIEDPAMMKFGAFYLKKDDKASLSRFHFFRNMFSMFMQQEFDTAEKGLPYPADAWWPDLQVMISRDKGGSTSGFFIATKGGNNDESHNHNDIGNYVVYYDGLPLLIDVGRGTYTAKTFSGQRYDIWYNCSDYHNVPTINGRTQPPGMKFRATDVAYRTGRSFSEMTMDIGASYPADAGIEKWQRNIRLNKGKNVVVEDVFQLTRNEGIKQHLMTCYPATVVKPGTLAIHYKTVDGTAKDFYVHYPANLSAAVEKVPLVTMEDGGIRQKWGDTIYRINFTGGSSRLKDKMTFTIAEK
ncbi:heparinase II/III family protein [Chitinophaga sp. XS-30]|uniref:heparinase II/III domain-containing protein n=1 Tax=Chitinophaga sp. XS-30 TaxID=2604421 RepID=UPI001FED9C74|nr:heparinase II/III family protein [Chitinophaga sp. XS-30]